MSFQSVPLGPAFPLPNVIDGIFGNSAGSYSRNQVGNESMIPNPISGRKIIESNPVIADSYESGASRGGVVSATKGEGGQVDPLFGHVGPESLLSRVEQSQMMGVLNIPRTAMMSLSSPASVNNGSQWNLFSAPVAPGSQLQSRFQSLLPRAPGGGVAPRADGPAGIPGDQRGPRRGLAGATYGTPPDRNGNSGVSSRADSLKTVRAGDRMPAEMMSGQSRRVAASQDRVGRKGGVSAPHTHKRKYKCRCGGTCKSCKKHARK